MHRKDNVESIPKLMHCATEAIASAGVRGARRDVRILICAAIGITPEHLFADPNQEISVLSNLRFREYVRRRCCREPVSRILGKRSFWDLDLTVTPDVLDPRPDSETLVETLLESVDDRQGSFRLLELGVGSGALLLSLLNELPYATGVGVDLCPNAIIVAKANAINAGLGFRTCFAAMNWSDALDARFDIVISNPPYVMSSSIDSLSPEVRCYDPPLAIDGGPDGLAAYRCLARALPGLLAPGAIAGIEIGYGQLAAVLNIFSDSNLKVGEIRKDLSGRSRCLVVSCPRHEKKYLA